jgi:hypothetical protein
VTQQIAGSDTPRGDVRFTRRTVRGVLGLSDTQLRVHLDRLVQLEYVRLHSGQNGSLYTYSLAFDGQNDRAEPQLMGLAATETAPTLRGKTATLRGQTPDLAGTLRPPCGDLAGTSRGGKMPRKPKPDVLPSVPDAVVAAKPRSRKVNGHTTAGH